MVTKDQARECLILIKERFNDRHDLLISYETEEFYEKCILGMNYSDVMEAIHSGKEGATLPHIAALENRITELSKTEPDMYKPSLIDAKANAKAHLDAARAMLNPPQRTQG